MTNKQQLFVTCFSVAQAQIQIRVDVGVCEIIPTLEVDRSSSMRHTASSHRQMKALFFILLLAGHDAVRVTQEAEWSKSKWNQLHAGCSWSLRKGCSEGCVRKRLPLDLPGESCRHTNAYLLEHNGLENYHAMIDILIEKSEKKLGEVEISSCRLLLIGDGSKLYSASSCRKAVRWNRKCRRREAQMTEAFQFIVRAFMSETFTASLDESEKAALNDGFQKVLKNLASSQDEAESMAELFKKMKCQKSEFLQEPKQALGEVAALGEALLSDNPDVKQRAKLQLEAMPESCRPVSADEEAEGLVKLKNLQKEFEQEPGEVSLAFDELDAAIDRVVEEEANETDNASSALQVSLSDSSKAVLALQKSRPPLLAVLFGSVVTVAMMGVFVFFTAPFWVVGLLGVCFWAISSRIFCFIFDYDDNEDCANKMFMLPFNTLSQFKRDAVNATVYIGKGIYKKLRKGNSTASTSALPSRQSETSS
eukprot:Skav206723  [mRNA]  locus=scaffold967:224487:226877:- [translate_table: standard]